MLRQLFLSATLLTTMTVLADTEPVWKNPAGHQGT